MFRIPDYYDNLSQRLSEVFNDIGVNEKMILKRRHAAFLHEIMHTVTYNTISKMSVYNFGSNSEGTTTEGLHSDTDFLICKNTLIVIQDYDEWQHGLKNLLMTKDENTPPGYCHLQQLRSDLPLPDTCVYSEHYVKVSSDKVLLKNTLLTSPDYKKHGPSWITQGRPGVKDGDHVPAFQCKSWPQEGKQCLQMRSTHKWPTQEMKKFAEKSTCFVVSVGSKVSYNENEEWRISTSLAERCLMFSLNITQIRCYILMKMIIKTYFKSQGEDHLSSFMCKTVLFYCIQNTHPSLWKEFNLLKCLIHCLQRLYTCLIGKNCPHFFIPGNNLMARKFSVQVQRKLQDKLYHIMVNIRQTLFGIHIDDIGTRVQIKLNQLHNSVQSLSTANYEILLKTSSHYFQTSTQAIYVMTGDIIQISTNHDTSGQVQQSLLRHIHRYTTLYRDGNTLEQTAISLLVRPICSHLGTIIASSNLQTNNHVSPEAFEWLKCGENSDVSSGRLKLASVLYCLGDKVRTEVILKDIQKRYNFHSTEPMCGCYSFNKPTMREQFAEEVHMKGILQGMKENTAFCVRFTLAEINCIPHELQYEMFRSTQEDLLHRKMAKDYWMDWAVVDSLPYLYFLQYKTYGQLHRYDDQQQALLYLILYIQKENLPGHRETALNLLGQCMEQENRIQDAMLCYYNSLTIRNRNNASKIHICRLIANLIRNQKSQ